MRKGSRTGIVAILAIVFALTFAGCAKTPGEPPVVPPVPPPVTDDFLVENETILRLGTQAAVVIALKVNPTYRVTVVKLADALSRVTFPTDGLHSLKEMVMKSIDLSRFSGLEGVFINLLVNQAVSKIEGMRDEYCTAKPSGLVCFDKAAWMKTTQIYIHKFSTWLYSGLALSDKGITPDARSAFPVLEPLR